MLFGMGFLFRLATLVILLSSATARANICGSDFQNFNPTSGGLDFVTVHSSETLKPCLINMGLFINRASKTLSFSQRYPGSTTNLGEKADDRITAGDLSAGYGLTQNWDFGVALPFIIRQEIKDPTGGTYYNKRGLNEIKLNTKYRFVGDDDGGFAGVLSFNQNLIKNNPFVGRDAGPTTNFELVADMSLGSFAVAANVGYRWRQSGDAIPNQPFKPLGDQYIYSVAGSYLIPRSDTKVILEVFGSRAAGHVDYDTNRSLNALEWLGGIKHDFSHSLAFHVGGGTEIGNALASPEWRVYTGLNWAIGPVCDDNKDIQKSSRGDHDVYTFSAEVLFDHDSDVVKEAYAGQIDRLMTELLKSGFSKIEVVGHTDSVGKAIYNLDLSQRRARSVKNYIASKHKVPEAKLTTDGKGETQPIADNGNFQGRKKNRRVEFKVWK